jgi:hypothetical protein
VKSADQTVSGTALANDSQLVFQVGANETWVFRFDINGNSPAPADWKFATTAPAGSTCDISASDFEGATAQANIACGVASGLISGSGADDPVWVSGTVTTGATAGTVTLQWAQFANSGTNTVRSGSSMTAFRVRGADLAEVYYAQDISVEEGDVVAMDGGISQIRKSNRAYDSKVIGVVSTKPGLVMGEADGSGKPIIVGLSGRVPVKVSTENGPIQPGDFLTASSTPGVAMKATGKGQVIGQALTEYAGAENGKVIVFIKNTYFEGEVESISGLDTLQGSVTSLQALLMANQEALTETQNNFTSLEARVATLELERNENSSESEDEDESVFANMATFLNDAVFSKVVTFTDMILVQGPALFSDIVTFDKEVVFNQDAGGITASIFLLFFASL